MIFKKIKTHLVKHKRTKKINYNNKKINSKKQIDRKNKKHYLTKYKLINKNNNKVQTGGDTTYYSNTNKHSSIQDLYHFPKYNLTIECENIPDTIKQNECYNKLSNKLRKQMMKINNSPNENLNSNSPNENLNSNKSLYEKLNNGTNKGYTKLLPRQTNPGYTQLKPKLTWNIKSGKWILIQQPRRKIN
jgi:hypothetical protein